MTKKLATEVIKKAHSFQSIAHGLRTLTTLCGLWTVDAIALKILLERGRTEFISET